MNSTTKPKIPTVELSTKEWTERELIDTERRFEKAFHEQTVFLKHETDRITQEISALTRWMIGLIVSMTFAIILAVLFKG
jgi:Na+(H+)/acetate symporter ActP